MALGANLVTSLSSNLMRKIYHKMGGKSFEDLSRQGFLVYKAGAPATNTAADDPLKDYVICYDSTNDDIYVSSSWVSSTSHTWTKIWD